MISGRIQKTVLTVVVILTAWVVFCQSCMKMRISDAAAQKVFAAVGVPLHTATVVVNNFKLHYAQTGSDSMPTLFFVHGSPGSWDAFSVYMRDTALLAKYRMIAVDRPGFGHSQFGDARNLAEQSAIISPFIKQLQNGQPFYIIGHSLGGPLAVRLVADNPNIFAGMVLLAASVDPAQEAPEKWRGWLHNSALRYLLPGAFRPSNTEIWYLKKDLPPLAAAFGTITCPTWIVHGDKDKFVPVGNAAYAQKMLTQAAHVETIILPGAPHFIPWAPWYIHIQQLLLRLPYPANPAAKLPH